MLQSPPSWRRGLKCSLCCLFNITHQVASFLEAWIEIPESILLCLRSSVASFLEAWIEILTSCKIRFDNWVASFLEAWIEIHYATSLIVMPYRVASFLEAWIEICIVPLISSLISRRLLLGGVD